MASLPEHAPPQATARPSSEWWLARTRKLRALSRTFDPRQSSRSGSSLAYPAIVLGVLINILDAASTGLLVFPTDGVAFQGLQAQSIAIFTTSTVICQTVFVLGGSNFSQAQGAMLIEVLPFMQTMASKLSSLIKDDREALLATVVTSYVLSSLILGTLLLALGFFEVDRWIAYFPDTVLVGALGAIGLSLFLSGFEVTQRSSFEWTLEYFRTLFTTAAMPVTVAALILAFVLSSGVRVKKRSGTTRPHWKTAFVRRLDWEVRRMCSSSFFIPMFPLLVGILFWVGASSSGKSMIELEDHHWVFTHVPPDATVASRMKFYDFWFLFNFKIVRWDAIKSIMVEIIILVIIGAINLPIYYPTLRDQLPDAPRTATIKREFIGHGISNIVSGLCGSLPNLIVMSNTIFFSRAGGDRPEAICVLILTALFLVFSTLVLPYIPVLCAALMVFFIGIELMAEALVPTWGSKSALEYLVIVGTMAACTGLGFAQGVGVGLAATLAALGFEHLADYEIRTCFISINELVKAQVLSQRVYDQLSVQSNDTPLQIGVISLSGTAGYTTASKVKLAIHAVQKEGCSAMVIDLTHAVRIDAAAAAAIVAERHNHQPDVHHPPAFLIGVPSRSTRYEVLVRAGAIAANPDELDPLGAADLLKRGLWPVSDFAEVVGWIASRASVSQPRLPRWARMPSDSASMASTLVGHVDRTPDSHYNSRQGSRDISLQRMDIVSPNAPTIDPTLPQDVKWRACWDQLCCTPLAGDAESVVTQAEKSDSGEGGTDMVDLSYSQDPSGAAHQVWRDSFVPVLEQFGRISYHEPRMLLSSATDPMPDIRIVVVGALDLRSVAQSSPPGTHALTSSNPAGKVDRTPADWLHSALDRTRPRLRRRTNAHQESDPLNEMRTEGMYTERIAQGDVVGLSQLNFAEPWQGDLLSGGHLINTTITVDFSSHDVRNVPELALALNTYHSHNQFRVQRIQDMYRRGVNLGEEYKW